MLILDYVFDLGVIAIVAFAVALWTKVFLTIRNVKHSFKSTLIFFIFLFSYPFMITNDVYSNRRLLKNKFKKDTSLTMEEVEKLSKLVDSRIQLFFRFSVKHVLELPSFIQNYSDAYKRLYAKKTKSRHESNYQKVIFKDIRSEEIGGFQGIVNNIKQKFS